MAVGAALVLATGLTVRRRLERTDRALPAAAPSEASALQQLSHEGLLRRATGFVRDRASSVARFVQFVPQSGTTGVRWGGDTLLTVDPERLIAVFGGAAADSGSPPVRMASDSTRAEWVIVVGRSRSGALLSVAGAIGGRAPATCGAREVEELLLDVPLSSHLAGAGLFDLQGALIGMTIRCGRRIAAIPARQIAALLAQPDSAVARRHAFGMSLAGLDSAARVYFGTASGVLVAAVTRGSEADKAGIRAGDVLVSVDGVAFASQSGFPSGTAASSDSGYRIERRRGRTTSIVHLPRTRGAAVAPTSPRNDATLGLELAPPPRANGVTITSVGVGSSALAAGLREGDRITRIGTTDVSSRAQAERLLQSGLRPLLIVVERDSMELGVLVRP
jgi:S1-C subfamily serine protease